MVIVIQSVQVQACVINHTLEELEEGMEKDKRKGYHPQK